MTQKLELLAPSGDWDSFLAAINNGADAIYLGLGDFNARAKSTFFGVDNIRATVRYAHLRGVKVYVTINTLVRDDEMPQFVELVEACVAARVDAYIVQDFGCARVLRQLFPLIHLHASTQMGIHNALGAAVAKKMGFDRVVLSRETKLADIAAIAALGIEVEYFVQGALCVAFSGNCYFSALKHDMSGNRGKCLQLCRLPYRATLDGETVGSGYLLSARDLCMLPALEELVDAGVISFKIEGRLRRAGYVAQAVRTYRQALDALAHRTTIDTDPEIQRLRQVFSRGDFCYRAYLDAGVPGEIIYPNIQNHLGLKIGEIVSVERFKDLYRVGIRSSHPLQSGDGLKFCDKEIREIDSLGVGNVEKRQGIYFIYTKHRLKPQLDVYLTLNSALEREALSATRRVSAQISFCAHEGQAMVITAQTSSPTPARVEFVSQYICTVAKTAPTQESEIREIFGSLNPELFEVTFSTIELDHVFIPKSALKNARRELLPQLEEQILHNYEAELCQITAATSLDKLPAPHTPASQYRNIVVIDPNYDLSSWSLDQSDLVILAPTDYLAADIVPKLHMLRSITPHVGLALPTIANGQDYAKLQELVDAIPADMPLLVQNAFGLELGRSHPLIAGCDMNVYNHFAIDALASLGVEEFVWSKEIETHDDAVYQFAYGRQTLMHFAHCPFRTLWGNSCAKCSYTPRLVLHDQAGATYRVSRHKIGQCYFCLQTSQPVAKDKFTKKYIDLR